MKYRLLLSIIASCVVLTPCAVAQDQASDPQATFKTAAATVQQQLADSLAELSAMREQIAAETVPMSRTLSGLENELIDVRQQFQQASRLLDTRTLDLTNLRSELKLRQEEMSYLSNLLAEYIRNFESRLHIAELQRYREPIEHARLVLESTNLSQKEVLLAQSALLSQSLDRLHEITGGVRFDGTAVDPDGMVRRGTFAMIGPVVIFQSEDKAIAGTVEQRLGSLEPSIVAFELPEDVEAATTAIASGTGMIPLDPTLGNAHKIAATEETLWEHIQKGGPVMVPIFALAGAALLVALFKWLRLLIVRKPSKRRMKQLLEAVARRDQEAGLKAARAVRGPTAAMLVAGVEHWNEPRSLIEEVMYEDLLATKLKLNRFLPFIAVCAAAAPLLGLLGTVTGIMNTFTLMTVFGTGDVKTLSSGISEALITTEFGLIVAIPALLLHALLSRKAKSVVDAMEKSAISFANQVSRTSPQRGSVVTELPPTAIGNGHAGGLMNARQVREALVEVLGPMMKSNAAAKAAAAPEVQPAAAAPHVANSSQPSVVKA